MVIYDYCRTSLKAAVVLLPLLGMTWIFGMLAINNDTIAFAWIFTILNSLQVCNYILISLITILIATYVIDVIGPFHLLVLCNKK